MINISFSGDDLNGVLAQMRLFISAHEVTPAQVLQEKMREALADAPKEVLKTGRAPPKGVETKPEPVAEVVQEVVQETAAKTDEVAEITYAEVREGVLKLAQKLGDKAKVLNFLNGFNVTNANQLDKARYPEFMAAIAKEIG